MTKNMFVGASNLWRILFCSKTKGEKYISNNPKNGMTESNKKIVWMLETSESILLKTLRSFCWTKIGVSVDKLWQAETKKLLEWKKKLCRALSGIKKWEEKKRSAENKDWQWKFGGEWRGTFYLRRSHAVFSCWFMYICIIFAAKRHV